MYKVMEEVLGRVTNIGSFDSFKEAEKMLRKRREKYPLSGLCIFDPEDKIIRIKLTPKERSLRKKIIR